MSSPSKRRFLVTPLDAEPPKVPEGTHVIQADSLETLRNAQEVKETIVEFVNGNLSFRKIKQLVRPK